MNTLSFVHCTGQKPDNEGTAKHELEGESVLDPGCVISGRNQPRPDMCVAAPNFTGAVPKS